MTTLGERLRIARTRAGLAGSQVRELTGIGESSLSEFENDRREPSLSQLQKLATAFQQSVAFFLDSSPMETEPIVVWRMRPERDAAQIEVKFIKLCQQYHNLEMWSGERAALSLPQATGVADHFRYVDAEELAKRVRRDLQLGDRPAQCLLAVLEEVCGVKVFHMEFEPSGTAASAMSPKFGAAILLNSRNARWRRNYDLAHELFHLLTWDVFHPAASHPDETQIEESLANCFASNLLMPTEPFRTAINARTVDQKISFASLFDVAREFDVSVEALLWRMHFVYGCGKAGRDQTRQDIATARQLTSLFEGRDSQKPHDWPERYKAMAVKALRRGEISIGRCSEYLNLSRQEAMRFIEQEVTEGEEVQVTVA